MSTTIENFFAPPVGDVPRQGGRPLLVPAGVPKDAGVRVPFTRASSLAGYISEQEHFHKWEMRYLCKAMGKHEDLAALAASETYCSGLTGVPKEQGEKARSGRRLDSIIGRALDRERIHEKADHGTAVHAFTEPGADLSAVPERMRPDVAAFNDAVVKLGAVTVGTEAFTVNDVTMSAGTFDHLMDIPHPMLPGLVITDKKTGRVDPHEWAIQLASYAYGKPYDIDADERTDWPGEINLEWAIVFRIPALSGVCEVYAIDIRTGWEMAQHAAAVRDYQEDNTILETLEPATFLQRLDAADTLDTVRAVWKSTTNVAERALALEKASTLS